MRITISSLLLVSILIGCISESKSAPSKYTGVWHTPAEPKIITEIKNNGEVIIYNCSVDGDYKPINIDGFSGRVDGNKYIVNFNGGTINTLLEIDNNTLTLIEETKEPRDLKRLYSIPEICDISAIEITNISTVDVHEGTNTSFTIDFMYRLSEPNETIDVYFSGNNNVFFEPEEGTIKVNQVLGTSSITVNHGPIELKDAYPYYVYIRIGSSIDRKLLAIHPKGSQ